MPFIFSWPDQIEAGGKFDDAIHHFDIFSTIAAAANVEVMDKLDVDGVNLLPFINKETPNKPHETLFWRSGNHQSVLHKNWKYLISIKENTRWLFDTSSDPFEKNNVIDNYPREAQFIESLLVEFNEKQSDPLFPSAFEAPIMIDKYDGQEYEAGDEYIYWSN